LFWIKLNFNGVDRYFFILYNIADFMDEPVKKAEKLWWQPAFVLFFELSGWIAGPIILAIFLGKWLDNKYGTEPWLYLSSVGMDFVISIVGIVRGAMKAMKQMEREAVAAKEQKEDK